jgi:hypothetical protein
MALLYANENFPQPAVSELRRFGHDVLATRVHVAIGGGSDLRGRLIRINRPRG